MSNKGAIEKAVRADFGPTARRESGGTAVDAFSALAKQVRPEHMDKVLGIVDRYVQAKLQQGLIETTTSSRIRLLVAEYQSDAARAEHAAKLLDELERHLTDEQKAEIAEDIIRVVLAAPRLAPNRR